MKEIADRARTAASSLPMLRITPSTRLAQVPWELLLMPDGRRLIEVVDLYYEPPSAIRQGRSSQADRDNEAADRSPFRVVDPLLPEGSTLRQILPAGGLATEEWLGTAGVRVDRKILGERLRNDPPSRLLFYGHVSADPAEPGSAAIHLTDDETTYGLSAAVGTPDPTHRPLSALDLLLGTTTVQEFGTDFQYPVMERVPGAVIWPMPPRVALIACESGGDHRAIETFGLVVAVLDAGADLVTSTRWILPSDLAFRLFADGPVTPTSDAAKAVDQAHEQKDPVKAIARWQRGRLAAWRQSGRLVDSPILWAGLTTHMVDRTHAGAPAEIVKDPSLLDPTDPQRSSK